MGFRDWIGLCSHQWFLFTEMYLEPWDKTGRKPQPKDFWRCSKCGKKKEYEGY